jgi:predicted transcriptional regulator
MDPRTMRWACRGDAADFRMSEERRRIVEALAALARPAAPTEIASLVGRQRHAVNKSLLAMATQGQLEWLPGGKYQIAGKANGKG